MASMSDILNELSKLPEDHPYLAEAIPTILGAVLSARRGRNGQPTTIGAPLGAGLLAGGQLIGNYEKDRASRQSITQQAALLGKTFPQALPANQAGPPSPPLSIPDFLQQSATAGVDPSTALKNYREAHPTEKEPPPTPFSEWRKFNPTAPMSDWENLITKPGQPTLLGGFLKANPNATPQEQADFLAQAHLAGERPPKPDKPERPREQVLQDSSGNAVIVNLDSGASRPLPGIFKSAATVTKPSRYVTTDGKILDLKAGDTIPAGATPVGSYGKPTKAAGEYWYSPDDKDWKWIDKGAPIPPSYTKSAPKEAAATKPTRYMLADGTIKDFLPGEKVPSDATSISQSRKAPPAPPKMTTPAQALANVKNAQATVLSRMGKPGGGFLGIGAGPSSAKVQGAVHDALAHAGLSDSGYPLKDGQKVKLSDGRIVTWKAP